jgi:hypothetical protein
VRRDLPLVVSFLVGFLVIGEFFFNFKWLKDWSNELQNWGVIVAAFALGLATVNLLRIHAGNIARRNQQRPYSIALIALFLGMSAVGILLSPNHPIYKFLFDSINAPSHATIFSMQAMCVTSLAYRALRVKTFEAGILLVTAAVLMIGRAPIGELIIKQLPTWADWIINVPHMAGQRGLMIGAGIGAVASGLRVLLGIERSQFGGGSET